MRFLQLAVLCIGVLYAPMLWASGLFGSLEFKANSIAALPKWERVVNRLNEEMETFSACDDDLVMCDEPALFVWRSFMTALRADNVDRTEQAYAVQTFINRWPYITDMDLWGLGDYWASPLEFLNHSGDCEDYAILKYVSLRELGVPAEDIRIVVVNDTVREIAHAVLSLKIDGEDVILDSLYNVVLSPEDLIQYIPYYSVNENSRWAHIMPLRP